MSAVRPGRRCAREAWPRLGARRWSIGPTAAPIGPQPRPGLGRSVKPSPEHSPHVVDIQGQRQRMVLCVAARQRRLPAAGRTVDEHQPRHGIDPTRSQHVEGKIRDSRRPENR